MNTKNKIATISVILALLLIAGNVSGKGSGLKQMWLTDDRGTYIGSSTDPWLDESILISESPFTLDLTNHLPHDAIDGTYLIITASRNPKGAGGIKVTIGPSHYSDYPGNIINQHLIADSEWHQVSGNNGVTYLGYNTAPHGILTNGMWYTIQQIDPAGNNKFLKPAQANSLYVDIAVTSPNPSDRIHIDSEGTHLGSGEIGFTGNPYSHDVTWQVPEFPTVALPIATVIGLIFLFQHRKNKGE
jgi:hypothetical protein